MDTNERIEPFINFVADGIQLGDSLGIDPTELLGSCLRYNMLEDVFKYEDFTLTNRVARKTVKDRTHILEPDELIRMLVEGFFFLPYDRVRPISQITG
jgi:hypothetical protein